MTFYKYKPINNYTLDSLQNKYFYYSRQEQLDDPFDMYTPVRNLNTDKEIREYLKKNPETAAIHTVDSFKKKQDEAENDEDYHKKILEVNQMFHVLCLTPINNNDTMWALYADNYKGIAVGYKAVKDTNNYYISLGKKRPINSQRNFLMLQGEDRFYENPDLRIVFKPIDYDVSKIKIFTPLTKDYIDMLDNIYIKKELWSFEKEYRSVIISPLHRYKDLKVYYPDEVLSEIIFGYKTPEENIKKVIELIKHNYSNFEDIKFYRAVPNRNKFTIEIKDVKKIFI